LPGFFPPFFQLEVYVKRVGDQQKWGPTCNSTRNGKKKGAKKGTVKPPGWSSLLHHFSRPFWLPFSIACCLGAHIAPQRSHTTSNVQKGVRLNFLDFIAHFLPGITALCGTTGADCFFFLFGHFVMPATRTLVCGLSSHLFALSMGSFEAPSKYAHNGPL
jgi:hypothetical protein